VLSEFSGQSIQVGGVEWGQHMGSWAWGLALLGLLFVLVVVGLVVWLVAYSARSGRPSGNGPKGALALVDERYARGEIDREEYLERRSDLER
jgi:putative membrane protein